MARPRARHRNRILQCPNCRSTHIQLIAGQILGQVYHCLDCDYQGSLVLEVDVDDQGKPLP